jgi:hypothetical protein
MDFIKLIKPVSEPVFVRANVVAMKIVEGIGHIAWQM